MPGRPNFFFSENGPGVRTDDKGLQTDFSWILHYSHKASGRITRASERIKCKIILKDFSNLPNVLTPPTFRLDENFKAQNG